MPLTAKNWEILILLAHAQVSLTDSAHSTCGLEPALQGVAHSP